MNQALENLFPAQKCRDGSRCENGGSCCLGLGGVNCCPYENAVCCSDGYTCCPYGGQCVADGSGAKYCNVANEETFHEGDSKLLSQIETILNSKLDLIVQESNGIGECLQKFKAAFDLLREEFSHYIHGGRTQEQWKSLKSAFFNLLSTIKECHLFNPLESQNGGITECIKNVEHSFVQLEGALAAYIKERTDEHFDALKKSFENLVSTVENCSIFSENSITECVKNFLHDLKSLEGDLESYVKDRSEANYEKLISDFKVLYEHAKQCDPFSVQMTTNYNDIHGCVDKVKGSFKNLNQAFQNYLHDRSEANWVALNKAFEDLVAVVTQCDWFGSSNSNDIHDCISKLKVSYGHLIEAFNAFISDRSEANWETLKSSFENLVSTLSECDPFSSAPIKTFKGITECIQRFKVTFTHLKNALTAYIQDRTEDNWNELKNSFEDLVNSIKDCDPFGNLKFSGVSNCIHEVEAAFVQLSSALTNYIQDRSEEHFNEVKVAFESLVHAIKGCSPF